MEFPPRKKKKRVPIEESAAYESIKRNSKDSNLYYVYNDLDVLFFEADTKKKKPQSLGD